MAQIITNTSTLDITFGESQYAGVGSETTWKLNDPAGSITSLSAVIDAFTFEYGGQSYSLLDYAKFSTSDGTDLRYIKKAAKVSTTITKDELT